MTVLSISVMAHRRREHFVDELQTKLGGSIPVAWDEKSDRWDTGRRAILAHTDYDSDWALVLQDDAVLPPRFLMGLTRCLEKVPSDSPLVLYCTRTKQWSPILDAVPHGTSYLTMGRVWWGVAVVFPSDVVEAVVEYGDTLSNPHYDHRVAWYFADKGIDAFYSWPNLVDHRRSPSLIEGRSASRGAQNYSRRRADTIGWSGDVVHVDPPASVGEPER